MWGPPVLRSPTMVNLWTVDSRLPRSPSTASPFPPIACGRGDVDSSSFYGLIDQYVMRTIFVEGALSESKTVSPGVEDVLLYTGAVFEWGNNYSRPGSLPMST